MDSSEHTFDIFIQTLVEKWGSSSNINTVPRVTVLTVSSEPGSGGQIIAKEIAEQMKYDLFHRDIIKEIADRADMSASVLESLEKDRLSGIEDFIASLVSKRYLWPERYLAQLMKIVCVIGKHGRAVISGRGANFMLPPDERLSIRIVAPEELRIQNIIESRKISEDDARKWIITKEAKRRAFIRKSFNADIADPINYDMVFNTGYIRYESVIKTTQMILETGGKSTGPFPFDIK